MKVLITNISLMTYGGSEIDTLSIAIYFKSLGYDVKVACFKYGSPMKELFEKHQIEVVPLLEKALTEKEFDLVWAHHADILNYCIFQEEILSKKVIHHILSPYEYLESITPYSKFISYFICNSNETKQKIIYEGVEEEKIFVFPNSAPSSYFESYHKVNFLNEPHNIVIISNHIPKELMEFLEVHPDKVSLIGVEGVQKEVNPELLSQYDLVITIGKTIQFCFAQGIPVYCYDRFGGPGYITKDNLKMSELNNFSGRGFNRYLTIDEITKDIFNNYRKNLEMLDYLHEYAYQNFNQDKNMQIIIKRLNQITLEVDLNLIRHQFQMLKRSTLAFMREYKKNYMVEISNTIAKGRVYVKRNGILEGSYVEKHMKIKDGRVNYHFDMSDLDINEIEAIYFYPSYGDFIKSKMIITLPTDQFTIQPLNAVKVTDEFDYFVCHDAGYMITGDVNQLSELNIKMKLEILSHVELTLVLDRIYYEMKESISNLKRKEQLLIRDLEEEKQQVKLYKSQLAFYKNKLLVKTSIKIKKFFYQLIK